MVKNVKQKLKKELNNLDKASLRMTNWVGTPLSLIIHSLLFAGIFALNFLGFSIDQILLILTTAVSLEAIYLAIFIQMTVNRNTQSLLDVEEDIEEIQEDVEDLEEDVEDISEDIDEIQAEEKEDELIDRKTVVMLDKIGDQLQILAKEIEQLKKTHTHS